jgi:hypothetical protein
MYSLDAKTRSKIPIKANVEVLYYVVRYVSKVVVPTVVCLVILVSLIFTILYRRRVNVFVRFNLHPFDLDECVSEDMSFDVFLSCAWEDDEAAQEILARLEQGGPDGICQGGYHVCYHARDFPFGSPILSSIQHAIEHSKRVICLVSHDFLSSEFCMLEFRSAWQRCLTLKKHRLIAIKWPDVEATAPGRNILDQGEEDGGELDARLFLSTHTYIEYGSQGWWEKLLYALPVNRVPRDETDGTFECVF